MSNGNVTELLAIPGQKPRKWSYSFLRCKIWHLIHYHKSIIWSISAVKPVYKGHPRATPKVAFLDRWPLFRSAFYNKQPLLGKICLAFMVRFFYCGLYSEVAANTGLTVYACQKLACCQWWRLCPFRIQNIEECCHPPWACICDFLSLICLSSSQTKTASLQ